MPLVVLLDTNVWVSAVLKPTGPPGQIVAAWRRDEFSFITSLSQLSEIAEVLNRPRLAQGRRIFLPIPRVATFRWRIEGLDSR